MRGIVVLATEAASEPAGRRGELEGESRLPVPGRGGEEGHLPGAGEEGVEAFPPEEWGRARTRGEAAGGLAGPDFPGRGPAFVRRA